LLVGIVVTVACLVLLTLVSPPQRHATFRLAIGPQMAISQGLGGSAAQGGPRAYMEALEAIAGVRLELRRSSSIESAIALLSSGAVDGVAFSLPSTRPMLPGSAVVSAPFYTGSSVLVSRRTSAYRSLASLAGRRVAVIDNGEYRAYLARHFPEINVLPLASPADMLAALDSGAADAALGADGILVPLARRDHNAILEVHAAHDGPPVELRVASVPERAVEVSMAHQALLALPLDIHKDILERTLNAVYRAPPTVRAVATYYRIPIILLCLVMLAFLLGISRAYRKARRAAARQAAAARVLTLVNHEVRNSASSVISAIDLAEGEPDMAQREQHVASARSAADALRHTLTNALEFMFHEASQRSCARASHSAQAVLEECLSGMRPLALSKGLGLSLALEGPDAALAHCDARALHHIASNLVSNAIKFSDAGAVGVRLGFQAGVGELGRVTLRVSDTGPGIEAEDIERIFEAFSSTAEGRRRLGAGIGLSLCRRIAISQGGDITVETRMGVGSTFLATLRGRREIPSVAGEAIVSDPADTPAARALVVEDQPTVAALIRRRLEAQHFRVTVAHTGSDALLLTDQEGPFALITLDGDLLDARGSDVALAIREIEDRHGWPAARLLSLSGAGETRDVNAYARAGVEAFLTKPVEWPVFDVAIQPAQRSPAVLREQAPSGPGQPVMAIYAAQMQVDIADLEAVIDAQNWRRALAMAHRIQGAASMVGDTATVVAICALQTCLKGHAINGDPAAQEVWELVTLLRRLRDAAGAGSPPVPPA